MGPYKKGVKSERNEIVGLHLHSEIRALNGQMILRIKVTGICNVDIKQSTLQQMMVDQFTSIFVKQLLPVTEMCGECESAL